MSIYGPITISGDNKIGEWYISRLSDVDLEKPNRYTYTVSAKGGNALAGTTFAPRTVHGFVEHDYRDGAIALLARVFGDAQKRISESIDTVGTRH